VDNDKGNNHMFPNQNNPQMNKIIEHLISQKGIRIGYLNKPYFVYPFPNFVSGVELPRSYEILKLTNFMEK